MEAAQTVSNMNLRVIKEPRGAIRFVQVILAIFAFATTCSVSTNIRFKITCDNSTVSKTVSVPFSYPFGLDSIAFQLPTCGGSVEETLNFQAGQVSPSQFFVAVGVLAFLYSLAAIVLYIFFDNYYRKENKIINGDFLITLVFALFWLIASSAWAKGVSDVKYYTDPDTGVFPYSTACKIHKPVNPNDCETLFTGNLSSLNISIIFGFLNFLVWTGSLWFLFKETPWHKPVQSWFGGGTDSSTNYSPDNKDTIGSSPTQPSST